MGARLAARGADRSGLALLTLLLLVTGHWVLAIVAGVPAVVAIWVFLLARAVRWLPSVTPGAHGGTGAAGPGSPRLGS